MSVKILHWSDNHNQQVTSQANLAAYNDSTDIDLFVHTGDLVNNRFEESIASAEPLNFAFCVGNHDALTQKGTQQNPYDWSMVPTLEQKWAKFFEPNAYTKNLNITEPETWWYKDFKDERLRIIGLDYTVQGDDYHAETQWLQRMLKDTIDKDYYLALCMHHYPAGPVVVNNNFNNKRYTDTYVPASSLSGANWYPMLQTAYYQVCNSCDNDGLKMILWFAGHTHADSLLISENVNKFPLLSVCSTLVYDGNWYWFSNLNRTTEPDNINTYCMNLYNIDTNLGTVEMYRLGAGTSYGGKTRNMCIWDFKNHKFISNYSRDD